MLGCPIIGLDRLLVWELFFLLVREERRYVDFFFLEPLGEFCLHCSSPFGMILCPLVPN